jgi:hypothetical protein
MGVKLMLTLLRELPLSYWKTMSLAVEESKDPAPFDNEVFLARMKSPREKR